MRVGSQVMPMETLKNQTFEYKKSQSSFSKIAETDFLLFLL